MLNACTAPLSPTRTALRPTSTVGVLERVRRSTQAPRKPLKAQTLFPSCTAATQPEAGLPGWTSAVGETVTVATFPERVDQPCTWFPSWTIT